MKRKFGTNTKVELVYDWAASCAAIGMKTTVDLSAITDDAVNNVLDSLNEHSGENDYSFEQVKEAMWQMLANHIDEYLEEIEDHFDKLPYRTLDRLLGDPEINVAKERRFEAGDVAFDTARDRQMEASAT